MGKTDKLKRETDMNLQEIMQLYCALPDALRAEMEAVTLRWCDVGDQHQIPPRQMAVALGLVLGALSLAEVRGEVHHNDGFDRFYRFASDALHFGIATARIRSGWTPATSEMVGHG